MPGTGQRKLSKVEQDAEHLKNKFWAINYHYIVGRRNAFDLGPGISSRYKEHTKKDFCEKHEEHEKNKKEKKKEKGKYQVTHYSCYRLLFCYFQK